VNGMKWLTSKTLLMNMVHSRDKICARHIYMFKQCFRSYNVFNHGTLLFETNTVLVVLLGVFCWVSVNVVIYMMLKKNGSLLLFCYIYDVKKNHGSVHVPCSNLLLAGHYSVLAHKSPLTQVSVKYLFLCWV